jgi:hypothetical protein
VGSNGHFVIIVMGWTCQYKFGRYCDLYEPIFSESKIKMAYPPIVKTTIPLVNVIFEVFCPFAFRDDINYYARKCNFEKFFSRKIKMLYHMGDKIALFLRMKC